MCGIIILKGSNYILLAVNSSGNSYIRKRGSEASEFVKNDCVIYSLL